MILVTGATGRVGSRVVEELRAAGAPYRVATRQNGFDLTSPASLDFGDAETVFLLWTAPPQTAPAVIDRLRGRRLVLLSSPHQIPHPFFQQPNPMATFHKELERLIASANIPTTILRPGMFASNTKMWWGAQIAQGDVVRWPYADVETAPIDERDIGAVAAKALMDEKHAGAELVITGPEAISHEGQLKAIGKALGRDLRYEEMTPDEFRAEMRAPPHVVNMLLNAWEATRGVPPYITGTVEEVLDRPARTFQEWADAEFAADR